MVGSRYLAIKPRGKLPLYRGAAILPGTFRGFEKWLSPPKRRSEFAEILRVYSLPVPSLAQAGGGTFPGEREGGLKTIPYEFSAAPKKSI